MCYGLGMPTPEEIGERPQKMGECVRHAGRRGRRRKIWGGEYVLCDECVRDSGGHYSLARRGRHRHGGKPGRLV